jgi:hypothetical protein
MPAYVSKNSVAFIFREENLLYYSEEGGSRLLRNGGIIMK